MSAKFILRGEWLKDGYILSDRPHGLPVIVISGVAYDETALSYIPESHRHEAALGIDADDNLRAWGNSIAFSPAVGEIDRIGRDCFKRV